MLNEQAGQLPVDMLMLVWRETWKLIKTDEEKKKSNRHFKAYRVKEV